MSSLNLTGVLRTHREEILRVLSRNGLSNPRIFGSAARWEDRPESDIDLLVDIEQRRSLLDLIAAKQDLDDMLGRTVDLVTERSLNPYIRKSVIEEVVPL